MRSLKAYFALTWSHPFASKREQRLYRAVWITFLINLSVWLAPALAQVPITGAGKSAPSAGYIGPGDLNLGSFDAWYSCAKAFTASFATSLAAVCDVVDTATGLTTCTFHIQATGSVDPTECNATACATACSITKAYDQTGNGKHATNATLAQMPTVDFSGLASFPGMKCDVGTCLLSSTNITRNQPFTYTGIFIQTTAVTNGGAMGDSNGNTFLGSGGSGNFAFGAGSNLTATAANGSYHAASSLMSGTGNNCAINIDGSDTAGLTCGTSNFGTAAFRINRANGTQMRGTIMETGMIGATTTSSDRNSYSSNAHTRYNF